MIKALILVQLWSLVVAGGAWFLQRDGSGRVGARFPAPNVWLTLIALALLPGVLYLIPFSKFISIPTTDIFEIFPAQISEFSTDSARPFNPLLVYIGLGIFLMARTLWRWSRLQGLPLVPTAEPDIFSTSATLPPLTLSWPRRAVVMPQGVEAQAALIRHERAHLRHNDAELTLLLLLLRDMMVRNPGISFLVQQWRLAIELRADRVATKELSATERKDYAAFLLDFQRPGAQRGEVLPCPTARLNSVPHRNAKMRLVGIIDGEPGAQKHRWTVALICASIMAATLGLTNAIATPGANATDEGSIQIAYARKTTLQLPANCPGLESDLKARGFEYETKEVTVNGQRVPISIVSLGIVIVGHDVRKDGTLHNVRVLKSTNQCFDDEAEKAVVQWLAEPQDFETKNAAIKLQFIMSAQSHEQLDKKLKAYLR